jgi:hypothetical protein
MLTYLGMKLFSLNLSSIFLLVIKWRQFHMCGAASTDRGQVARGRVQVRTR